MGVRKEGTGLPRSLPYSKVRYNARLLEPLGLTARSPLKEFFFLSPKDLSWCLFVCLFVCIFVCLFGRSVGRSVGRSFVCSFVCLFVCCVVCLFVCLFVCYLLEMGVKFTQSYSTIV